MSDKQTFFLVSDHVRMNAVRAVRTCPDDWMCTIQPRKRSLDQNAKLWAMLSDVAKAKPEGRQWTVDTWKAAFMHSLGHQVQFCEGLDDCGPFPIGFRSSRLTVKQMSDLIETIYEYGSRHGVAWSEGYGMRLIPADPLPSADEAEPMGRSAEGEGISVASPSTETGDE